MSPDDDTCMSLITAIVDVFKTCGVTYYQPATNEHFLSLEDFKNHADEVWQDIVNKARSKSVV